MPHLPELTPDERNRYEWQLSVPDFGEEGQRRLKAATVLVSRIGGVGGTAAMQLAAAGIGRLILAHAGDVRLNDLNRQLLMSHDGLGTPRMDQAVARLKALNPRLEIVAEPANISEANAARLVAQADVVVDCAPLFANIGLSFAGKESPGQKFFSAEKGANAAQVGKLPGARN